MNTRTVLITGSTSGIGLGIANAFAAKGYNILFNGVEKNGAEIAAGVAERYQIQHLFSSADARSPQALREMVKQCVATFGSVDVLVNNAGIQHVSPVEDFPDDKWDDIIAINLSATFHLAKAVWPVMKSHGFGRIINIASIHGLFASAFKTAYVAAKHGIVGLTKALALEGAPINITCNAICPGYVRTPLVEKQVQDQARAHNMPEERVMADVLLAKQAVKSFIPIETVCAMVMLLAEDESGTITGTALPLDGGWSAQ